MDLTKRATMLGTREVRGGLTASADAPAGVVGADWSPMLSLRADDAGDDSGFWDFAGEASIVEHPYTVYDMFGEFTETVAEGAFTKTLAEDPLVSFVYMHSLATVMAQTRGRNLELKADPNLSVGARLAKDDVDVQRIVPKIRSGLANSMSFAFRVTRQEWDEDYMNRRILEVNLQGGDVSVITTGHGANPAAHGDLREIDLDRVLRYLADTDDEERAQVLATIAPRELRADATDATLASLDARRNKIREDQHLLDALAVQSL